MTVDLEALADTVLRAPRSRRRRLIALAGPPASGKSTLADMLARQMCTAGCTTQVVPMDGFHLDNAILIQRGLLPRKGAPETFDVNGFATLIARLKTEDEVVFPTFDRTRDIAIAGARVIGPDCDTVVVEGNYLLYDAPGWKDLRGYWDLAIALHVPTDVLRQRLIDRWMAHGLSLEQSIMCAEGNDLANARLVEKAMLSADIMI